MIEYPKKITSTEIQAVLYDKFKTLGIDVRLNVVSKTLLII